jgi:hypothetical protein
MKMNCPKCQTGLDVEPLAVIRDDTKMVAQLDFDGPAIDADTIGGFLTAFANVQRATAKQIGVDVITMLSGVEFRPGSVSFTFNVMRVKP